MKKTSLIILGAVVAIGLIAIAKIGPSPNKKSTPLAPVPDTGEAHWIGRESCATCHTEQSHQWTGSDHDLAMQVPTANSVTADFDNTSFTYFGVTTTFSVVEGTYMVRTDGPDGVMTNFEVAFVFGHDPIEQYLIRFADGRLQALNVCWDSRPKEAGGQRWFHLYPDQEVPADDLFHWTATFQNWNFMCAECHSTNLQRNYDQTTNTYDTQWFEIDVSCEACHGPGSRHETWAQTASPGDKSQGLLVDLTSSNNAPWIFADQSPTASKTGPASSTQAIESCARCHARRAQINEDYTYGKPFADHHRLTLLTEGLYHADGQNQDEVYVYGSFQQSKMYAAGVTCTDCHDAHSAQTLASGNNLCARCHKPSAFDTPAHHFHEAATAQCVDCHMRSQNLMVIDGRRDHSFRIPRPDLSQSIGTPNACLDCHSEQSNQWAQTALENWYGPDLQQGPHFGIALAAGRAGSPGALDRLRFLSQATDQPDIARATAISLASRFAATSEISEIVQALADKNPLLRAAAVRSLATSSPDQQLALAMPLLDDKVGDVRMAAAEIVASLPFDVADPNRDNQVRFAHQIWQESLLANAERPESQLGLAAWHINRQEYREAEACFERALVLEKRFTPSYVNYADYLRRAQRPAEAQAILQRGISNGTEPAAAHHALGLMLISAGDTEAALAQLASAANSVHYSARYAYVYAVALHDNGQMQPSLDVLGASLAEHRWDLESLQAMVLYALASATPERGLSAADDLIAVMPNDPQARALKAQLQSRSQK